MNSMRLLTRLLLVVVLAVLCGLPAWADPIVEIESRGQKVRAVLLKPANPKGAVILLAGGDGRLDITPGGEITKLRFNQLVRTRALYERSGYVTLVPDIAPGFEVGGSGVAEQYRASRGFAQDIGAMVKYLHGVTPKPIGTYSAAMMIRSVASTRPPQSRTIAARKATKGTTTAPRLAIFWLVGMALEAKEQDRDPLVGFVAPQPSVLVAFL